MSYAAPHITTFSTSLLPAPPNGWKFVNLVDPNKLDSNNVSYPVLLFGSYTYTALSSTTNDPRMKIVAWDMKRNLVKELEKPGARYIWRITFNPANQTVTFIGQSSQSVQATLDELVVSPSVVYLPSSSGPVLPNILTYAATDPSRFPVIKSGPNSFWPVSYKDGRNSFAVVVVDQDNVIQRLINCPGTHVIRDVQVNAANRTIVLQGHDGSKVAFDYKTAMVCFYCCFILTKDDFLFVAKYFKLPLSDVEATALAKAMPQIDCAVSCQIMGTYDEASLARAKRSTGGAVVGSVLGGLLGAMGGFLIGGPVGLSLGFLAGSGAGMGIGVTVPSSTDLGHYKLSSLERDNSLVGYSKFPCGPFDNTGLRENIHQFPYPRYQDLPYSAAVVKSGAASAPRAYSPATKSIGAFPRDPSYNPYTRPGDSAKLAKYIFVIIKTDEIINGQPGYQMRINSEDFFPDGWNGTRRVNHSQLSEGYRFWALVGQPHMQVYAAGSLYLDITNQKIIGIDTRTGHYYRSFTGQDRAVSDATIGFLANLGYPTRTMLGYLDMHAYWNPLPINAM